MQTQGTDIETALARDPVLASKIAQDKVEVETSPEKTSNLPKEVSSNGKLVVAEEIVEGHIALKSLRLFLSALGGHHPSLFFVSWILAVILSRCVLILRVWFLGVWGSQYESKDPSEVNLTLCVL